MATPKIILNKEIFEEGLSKGLKINQMLERTYKDELADLRTYNVLKDKSATKLMLIDHGIEGGSKFENLFKTEHNEFLYPAYMADIIDTTMQKSDVLQYMVGTEVGIDPSIVKAPTVDLLSDANKKQLRRAAVAEGAEFPIRTVKTGTVSTELYKKGIAIQQTYESARELNIDLVSLMLNAVTSDVVGQNIDAVVATLEAGTIFQLGITDTANKITNDELLSAIVGYKIKYGYMPDTIVCNEVLYKELAMMKFNNTEEMGLNKGFSLAFPQLGSGSVNIVLGSVSKTSNKERVLMYNKEMGIIRYLQNGSALTEYDTKIINQTNQIVISEVSGYANFVNSVAQIVSA